MSFSNEVIYLTLSELALRTGQLIRDGAVSRLGIFEETLTDVNLIEINRRHSKYIRTYKYTRREEGSKSGADWLWCIGEPGSWISLAVQAKIINPQTLRCQHLNYTGKQSNSSNKRQSQRSLLVNFAHTHNLLPIYCVYNYLSPNLRPYAKAALSLTNIENYEWYVKRLIEQRRNRQSDLLHYGIPWSYPFLHTSSSKESPKLASMVAQALANLREEFINLDTKLVETGLSLEQIIRHDDPEPLSLITKSLPRVAERLLSGSTKPYNAPVSGLSIISSVPVEKILHEYAPSPKSRKTQKSFLNKESAVRDALPEPNDSMKISMEKMANDFFSKKK
jgi:hypothetical protein